MHNTEEAPAKHSMGEAYRQHAALKKPKLEREYTACFYVYEAQEEANLPCVTDVRWWWPLWDGDREHLTGEGKRGPLGSRKFLYLNLGVGYTGVYIHRSKFMSGPLGTCTFLHMFTEWHTSDLHTLCTLNLNLKHKHQYFSKSCE